MKTKRQKRTEESNKRITELERIVDELRNPQKYKVGDKVHHVMTNGKMGKQKFLIVKAKYIKRYAKTVARGTIRIPAEWEYLVYDSDEKCTTLCTNKCLQLVKKSKQ